MIGWLVAGALAVAIGSIIAGANWFIRGVSNALERSDKDIE